MSPAKGADPIPLPPWLLDVGPGLLVFLVGLAELFDRGRDMAGFIVVVLMAVAAGLWRRAPGVALTLVYTLTFVHLALATAPMLVELSCALVAFGTSRYGSRLVLWVSALSAPLALGLVVIEAGRRIGLRDVASYLGSEAGWTEWVRVVDSTSSSLIETVPLLVVILAVPWLIGLTLRVRAQSQARAELAEEARREADERRKLAESQRAQAEQIAELREGQARLARDVHDVVGHSLAVILAQAESARYLPDGDPTRVQQVFDDIAASARRSLQDVHQVLGSTADGETTPTPSAPPADLDSLVDGVRSAGHEVRTTVTGTPRPLPPELATVVYRVLQEMLTNALKHGRRDTPVDVDQAWGDELRLTVRNTCGQPMATASTTLGVAGMERRLASVGGRLERTRTGAPDGTEVHEAMATIPLHIPSTDDPGGPT